MGLRDRIKGIFVKASPAGEPRTGETTVPAPEETEPKPPQKHWEGDMVPRETGPGQSVEHSGGGFVCNRSVRLEWVSRETDREGRPLRTRTPACRTVTRPKGAFTAAGEPYGSLRQLAYRWEDKSSPWARDIYGRAVLAVAERFPCFDSSDYLYENRYFRWFLLCLDGKFTCVYHTDGTNTVTVTEDVLEMEEPCWKEINRLKCFEEDGI